ncbi:hypothetical protein MNBD_ALPHA08-575 [hydrothermal vent metagenome]|uniref:Uncharacterized protein n=1 Tax=hydrothermal vent metagenome TaxID=652676 RepID=A0A3B0RXL9_9ZZZZ
MQVLSQISSDYGWTIFLWGWAAIFFLIILVNASSLKSKNKLVPILSVIAGPWWILVCLYWLGKLVSNLEEFSFLSRILSGYGWLVFQMGWLIVVLVVILVNASALKLKKKLAGIFGLLALVWLTTIGLYWLGQLVNFLATFPLYQWDQVIWDQIKKPFSWAYYKLDRWLFPWTNEFVFLTPVGILLIDTVRSNWLPSGLKGFLGVWLGGVILYLGAWSVTAIFENPYVLLLYISFFFTVSLFGFSSGKQVEQRYSATTFIQGLKFRSFNSSENNNGNLIVRQVVITMLVLAFWFQLSVEKSVLATLYSTLFGGLLTIIGFAALIFTFSFERIPSVKMKRHIANDTKAIYRSVGTIASVSVIGLLFFTGSDIVFNFEKVNLSNIVGLCFLIIAIVGTIISVESAISLFRQLIGVLSGINLLDSNIVVAFDELRTPPEFSAMSEANTGLSHLRSHIEETGLRVVSIETAEIGGLSRLRNAIYVVQRITDVIEQQDAVLYRKFVERGDVMIVLVDAIDLKEKRHLLEELGFKAKVIPVDGTQPLKIDNFNSSEISLDIIGDTGTHFYHTTAIQKDEEIQSIAKCNEVVGPWGGTEETIVIAKKKCGRGLLVVVGSVMHWQNNHIFQCQNLDCLDGVLKIATDHFLQEGEKAADVE